MLDKTLLTANDLEIRVSDHADDELIDILNHSVQGAEGGLRYSFNNIPGRIADYGEKIRFLSLYKKNKMKGTVGACFRMTRLKGDYYSSTFIRYLAFLSTYQTDRRRRRKPRPIFKHDHNDSFKQNTLELFDKPYLFELPHILENNKHISYALVECMNERSNHIILQAGFEYIRSFLTLAFSRFNPKVDERVGLLDEASYPLMKDLLNSFYYDYSFYQIDNSFSKGNYYILKENDEIIAGVCASPSSLTLYNVPDVWGWVIKDVLPVLPGYKKLFPPRENFKFLGLDAIYCKKGKEPLLATLFESVCAINGYYSALTWLDDRSELFDKIRSDVKMGPVNRMLNAKPGRIYAKFCNLSPEEKERFYDAPSYISALDLS